MLHFQIGPIHGEQPTYMVSDDQGYKLCDVWWIAQEYRPVGAVTNISVKQLRRILIRCEDETDTILAHVKKLAEFESRRHAAESFELAARVGK